MEWNFSNIEEKYNCPHGFDRPCRGCRYSSDLALFDGCCLYPDTRETFHQRKRRQSEEQTEPGA